MNNYSTVSPPKNTNEDYCYFHLDQTIILKMEHRVLFVSYSLTNLVAKKVSEESIYVSFCVSQKCRDSLNSHLS